MCACDVTMQLDDLLQVNEDVSDVLSGQDSVSVQSLVENAVHYLQCPQVGSLSVEQLWTGGGQMFTCQRRFCNFIMCTTCPARVLPLMTSCRLISCGVRLSRTPLLTRHCQFSGSPSHSTSPPWSSSLWMSADVTAHCMSTLLDTGTQRENDGSR